MKKHDLPAQPFYWGDWFKATDIQMLPRDVRCTWFEMLGRMWENTIRGELSVNGVPPTLEMLSQLLGFGNDVKECERHLKILEEFSVYSRKKNGVIYCRRMVKDEELSRKRSESGKLGMQARYNICYSKTSNKRITNTENEIEYESVVNKGGVGGKWRNESAGCMVVEIINDLNRVCGTSYKPKTPKTVTLIEARMKEGFTVDDFKKVHRIMFSVWGKHEEWSPYLRPCTLYSTKFESYLNRKSNKKETETSTREMQNWEKDIGDPDQKTREEIDKLLRREKKDKS